MGIAEGEIGNVGMKPPLAIAQVEIEMFHG
jgi:hypothetical protein